jgi:hypothetical protein
MKTSDASSKVGEKKDTAGFFTANSKPAFPFAASFRVESVRFAGLNLR